MNVEIPQDQIEQLNTLAAQTGKGTDELVQEAVSKMLAYNDWFKAKVQVGVDQIQRGNFIEEPQMNARVQKMLRSCGVSARHRRPPMTSAALLIISANITRLSCNPQSKRLWRGQFA